MKLSTLLSQRPALLQQVRLANVAFAYHTLSVFAGRVAQARLQGTAILRQANPDEGQYAATLTVPTSRQSVVDEHFTEDDLMGVADVFAFVLGKTSEDLAEVTFNLEDVADLFVAPLRRELEQAGIALDAATEAMEKRNR